MPPAQKGSPRASHPGNRAAQSAAPVAITTRKPSLLPPLIALAVFLGLGILLQFVLMPGGWVFAEKPRATQAVAEIQSIRGVRINEVMTANKAACYDENGACPDWIELYNASSSPVDITGWVLTDKTTRSIRFTFPEYVMESGAYAIVFADGFLHNGVQDTWHAPFRLSSMGDTLMLFDANGTVVESMNIPALDTDQSYAFMNGSWTVTGEYTPMMENNTVNYAMLTSTRVAQNSDIIITEVMASNKSFPSPSGIACDWIEITNRGTEEIDLSGWGLSDKATKPSRWRFPQMTIKPGEYLVIYASGLDKNLDSGEMHTGFSLAAEGEDVLLYAPSRQIMDAVTYENMKTDKSWKRQADGGWTMSNSPTPGSGN